MSSTVNWSGFLQRLSEARDAVLLTHVRPDGDALGSLIGLTAAIRACNGRARPILFDPVPPRYAWLLEDRFAGAIPLWNAAVHHGWLAEADTVFIVDTGSAQQVAPAIEALRAHMHKVAVLDHHRTRDLPAPILCVDPSAGAACLMVLELLEARGVSITPALAEALLAGLSADTGWFKYSNTDARALRAAARLQEAGAPWAPTYRRLFQADSLQRLRLTARAFEKLELHAGGAVATVALSLADFAAVGAGAGEAEGLLDAVHALAAVQVSALLTEQADGPVRVNLRAKGPYDVSRVAQSFGGGGHVRASGCRLSLPLDGAVRAVVAGLEETLARGPVPEQD